MNNGWALAVVCVGGLTFGGLAVAGRTSEQDAARQLYRALNRYSYYYDALRSSEANLARAQNTPEQFAAKVRILEQQLVDLSDRLSALKIDGAVRRELLDPLVRRLRDDQADLSAIRDHVERRGLDRTARKRLSERLHPPDAFDPAINAMRQRFGFRQRLWRGHPLTV